MKRNARILSIAMAAFFLLSSMSFGQLTAFATGEDPVFTGMEPGEVRALKTVTPVEGVENAFDITLQVKGQKFEWSSTTPVSCPLDVVFVIDKSGSMGWGSGVIGPVIEDCDDCDGDGKIDCDECDGDGKYDCDECDGTGKIDCDDCDGDGKIDCPDCYKGKIWCPDCGGDGIRNCTRCYPNGKIKDKNNNWITCPDCGGDKKIPCITCSSTGILNCTNCGGTGELVCSDCGGTGKIDCDDCGGEGEFVCSDCGGTGEFVCSDCGGTGKVTVTRELTRLEVTRAAAATAASTLLSKNANNRVAVVTYSDTVTEVLDFSSSASAVTDAINGISSPNGGTWIQGGYEMAGDLLYAAGHGAPGGPVNTDAVPVIILLSDGAPTYHTPVAGDGSGGDTSNQDITDTIGEAAEQKARTGAKIFTIGVTSDANGYRTLMPEADMFDSSLGYGEYNTLHGVNFYYWGGAAYAPSWQYYEAGSAVGVGAADLSSIYNVIVDKIQQYSVVPGTEAAITDNIGTGFSPVGVISVNGVEATSAVAGITGDVLTWNIGSIPTAAVSTLTFRVQLDSGLAPGYYNTNDSTLLTFRPDAANTFYPNGSTPVVEGVATSNIFTTECVPVPPAAQSDSFNVKVSETGGNIYSNVLSNDTVPASGATNYIEYKTGEHTYSRTPSDSAFDTENVDFTFGSGSLTAKGLKVGSSSIVYRVASEFSGKDTLYSGDATITVNVYDLYKVNVRYWAVPSSGDPVQIGTTANPQANLTNGTAIDEVTAVTPASTEDFTYTYKETKVNSADYSSSTVNATINNGDVTIDFYYNAIPVVKYSATFYYYKDGAIVNSKTVTIPNLADGADFEHEIAGIGASHYSLTSATMAVGSEPAASVSPLPAVGHDFTGTIDDASVIVNFFFTADPTYTYTVEYIVEGFGDDHPVSAAELGLDPAKVTLSEIHAGNYAGEYEYSTLIRDLSTINDDFGYDFDHVTVTGATAPDPIVPGTTTITGTLNSDVTVKLFYGDVDTRTVSVQYYFNGDEDETLKVTQTERADSDAVFTHTVKDYDLSDDKTNAGFPGYKLTSSSTGDEAASYAEDDTISETFSLLDEDLEIRLYYTTIPTYSVTVNYYLPGSPLPVLDATDKPFEKLLAGDSFGSEDPTAEAYYAIKNYSEYTFDTIHVTGTNSIAATAVGHAVTGSINTQGANEVIVDVYFKTTPPPTFNVTAEYRLTDGSLILNAGPVAGGEAGKVFSYKTVDPSASSEFGVKYLFDHVTVNGTEYPDATAFGAAVEGDISSGGDSIIIYMTTAERSIEITKLVAAAKEDSQAEIPSLPADSEFGKTLSLPQPGGRAVFKIIVTNTGDVALSNVIIADTLDENELYYGSEDTDWVLPTDESVIWQGTNLKISSFAPDATKVIYVTVDMPSNETYDTITHTNVVKPVLPQMALADTTDQPPYTWNDGEEHIGDITATVTVAPRVHTYSLTVNRYYGSSLLDSETTSGHTGSMAVSAGYGSYNYDSYTGTPSSAISKSGSTFTISFAESDVTLNIYYTKSSRPRPTPTDDPTPTPTTPTPTPTPIIVEETEVPLGPPATPVPTVKPAEPITVTDPKIPLAGGFGMGALGLIGAGMAAFGVFLGKKKKDEPEDK